MSGLASLLLLLLAYALVNGRAEKIMKSRSTLFRRRQWWYCIISLLLRLSLLLVVESSFVAQSHCEEEPGAPAVLMIGVRKSRCRDGFPPFNTHKEKFTLTPANPNNIFADCTGENEMFL